MTRGSGDGVSPRRSSPTGRSSPKHFKQDGVLKERGGPLGVLSVLGRVRRALWGDLPPEEYGRLAMLSATFMFIVGSYWLLRTQKDALFMKITGSAYIPHAKMVSFVVLVPLILAYSKLVDLVPKQVMFYVICGVYGSVFLGFAMLLGVPGWGVEGDRAPSPSRLLGWAIYLSIESFGSLCVPLFWSFVNSITNLRTAKAGFGLITWGAQFGSVAGPSLSRYGARWGMPVLMAAGGVGVLVVPVLVAAFVRLHPSAAGGDPSSHSHTQTGVVEGLRLILRYPYLLGVLCLATCHEVIATMLDYQLKVELNSQFKTASEVAAYMGVFGQWANGLTFVFSLVGTGFFLNTLGLTACLVLFPGALSVVLLWVMHRGGGADVLFAALVLMKGLSYALNNPCKEILYLPTSKDVKFKAKSWIDSFGGRAAKSLGSLINSQFSPAALSSYSGPISLGLVGFWASVALWTGRKNQQLVDREQVLGEDKPRKPK
eukprot:RCo050173